MKRTNNIFRSKTTFPDILIEEATPILRHMLTSMLLAARYGLIALCVTLAVGKGCKTFPLIKAKTPVAAQTTR